MKIGIIGAGNIGATLARNLTAGGHEIKLANSLHHFLSFSCWRPGLLSCRSRAEVPRSAVELLQQLYKFDPLIHSLALMFFRESVIQTKNGFCSFRVKTSN
jgi:nucleoside-diphosphate-sugar epimerase